MTFEKTLQTNLSIDGNLFIVLINAKKEYSLWPANKSVPQGWDSVNFSGTKDECKAYIDERWLSLMPLISKAIKH